jgi:hypothetical protein
MAIWVLALFVLAIRFAEPILDGDLFWHLAYAQQMLARGTLIPDHTLYSWTPATNATIYCVWLGDLMLLGLYRLGGLPLLFALRYACLAVVGALMLLQARRLGMLRRPATGAIVLLVLLAGLQGTLIKPELFSLLLFHVVVFAYASARAIDRRGGDARPMLLAVPIAVLVWVNTHGGFILAAPFFAATFAAEAGLGLFAPKRALAPRARRTMAAAWILSGLAVFCTPYGRAYPLQLIGDYALHRGPRLAEVWNSAYQPLLGSGQGFLVVCGCLMAGVLAALLYGAARSHRIREVDPGLILALVVSAPLFLLYLRSTFYTPVVFGYAALDLLRLSPEPARRLEAITAAALAACVGLGGVMDAHAVARGSWIGFGVGYVNPVPEAEFLARSRLGPRLYNTFNAGGYLLWRLWPAHKVMVDSRYFPFADWFDDLYDFTHGENVDGFLAKFPGDVAVIDLDLPRLWGHFLESPRWRLVYYGPTAAVFAPAATPASAFARDVAPDRFDRLRNGVTALQVFDFALVEGDAATAWKVLAEVETGTTGPAPRDDLARAIAVREGYRQLLAGDVDAATPWFTKAAQRRVRGSVEAEIERLLSARLGARANGDVIEAARDQAEARALAGGVAPP